MRGYEYSLCTSTAEHYRMTETIIDAGAGIVKCEHRKAAIIGGLYCRCGHSALVHDSGGGCALCPCRGWRDA